MKRIAIIIGLAIMSASCMAQPSSPAFIFTTTAPVGNCTYAPQMYLTKATGVQTYCVNGSYASFTPGGGGSGITALTQDVTASGTGSVAATVHGINGTLLSGLATGILKNTTTTGVPSIAAANTDYLAPNGTTTGTPAASVSAISSTTAIFTGGNGTTTFPYWKIEPSGATTETGWNTQGTLLGINAPSGFSGNIIDYHLNNAATVFRVNNTGSVIGNQAIMSGIITSGQTKFTATGCTSISSTVGTGTTGKFTIGAATCTVVITMNGATGLAATNGWSCHANDETTAAGNTGLYFSTNNTTTATLTVPATAVASDVIDFGCQAY